MSYQPQNPNQPGQPYQAAPAYATGVPGPGEPYDGASSPDDLTRPLYGASFGQAVKRFFKNYANFKGRASRSEYWFAQLFVFLLQVIPGILYFIGVGSVAATAATSMSVDEYGQVTAAPGAEAAAGGGIAMMAIGGILMVIIGLAVLVPSLAIAWRRLHDANFAGPFWFLSLTSIGSIVVLVFTIMPPKPEGRRFDAR